MACIQRDEKTLNSKQMDMENQHIKNAHCNHHQSVDNSISSLNLGCNPKWSTNISPSPPLGGNNKSSNKPIGWMDGLLGWYVL